MIFAYGLLLAAQAVTSGQLLDLCGDGYDSWTDVAKSQWYFEDDWEEQIADGNNVNPAGFRPYLLGRYNEPPVCLFVDGSRNKKLEILVESPMENANLCITDGGYLVNGGISNNNVGAVQVCGTGKIYACFTAAVTDSSQNFGFVVSCEEGCEDMDIALWVRVRLSDRNWNAGKDGVYNDLEHWCEGERGSLTEEADGFPANLAGNMYYTYPSDLIPDEPSEYPFHIQQIFGRNSGSTTKPHIWLVSVVAVFGLACLFW
jgi:hypothetical protein